jgi:hypothetical protein
MTKIHKYPEFAVRPFGFDVLSVPELMKWAKNNKYTLPDNPPLHEYDFVQIEGFLNDVMATVRERTSLEEAEIRIGTPTAEERANPRLLKPGEEQKMFPQWAVAGAAHVRWRTLITDAIESGLLTKYDGATLFPIAAKAEPAKSEPLQNAPAESKPQSESAVNAQEGPAFLDGEPKLQPGPNKRAKVDAWVKWQAEKLKQDDDNGVDLAERIRLVAEKYGYESERGKMTTPSIITMLPPGITGGRGKNRNQSEK